MSRIKDPHAIARDYLPRILTARVYDVARETPLEQAPRLSARTDNTVWLKREDQQSVFSFKLRGAYNKMAHLSAQELAAGVICASAGNHAQGVALAARQLKCRAVVVMPVTTPQVKVAAVRQLGAEVHLRGDSFSDAHDHARTLEREQGLTFVHPFDDPHVIAGQGTVAMEMLRQHRGAGLDAVFVAIGGGGLISGVAAYIKAVQPAIRIIGVQARDSDAMLRSVQSGRRVMLQDVGLFSDGTAVKQVGRETFRLARALVDDYVVVDTDAICAAIKDVFEDTRSVLEPAGALAVAGLKHYAAAQQWQGRQLAAITCGANMNFDRLRFVSERAEVGEHREALLAVTMPETPGSFRSFCAVLGPRSVTEFNYRMDDARQAHVLAGVAINDIAEAHALTRQLQDAGFDALDLTGDELAKTHLRHMIGGASSAPHERLFRFIFPERPGALMRFVSHLQPHWNISLFHYRHLGGDDGHILVGMQVPRGDGPALKAFLAALAYPCTEVTDHPAYRLFLRR